MTQQIHIATHDSIGTGEDGPTHQPVELAALYRAMPNLLYIRPCDSEETAGAVLLALSAKRTPSMISVSRQNNPQYPHNSSREHVQKGGYVFMENPEAQVTLLGAGAEMRFAVEAKASLEQKHGVAARVVSMPCWRVFEAQGDEHKRGVLRRQQIPTVAIEAYAMIGWERYADAVSVPGLEDLLSLKSALTSIQYRATACRPLGTRCLALSRTSTLALTEITLLGESRVLYVRLGRRASLAYAMDSGS